MGHACIEACLFSTELTGMYGGRYGPLTDEFVRTIYLYLDGETCPDLRSSHPKVPQS